MDQDLTMYPATREGAENIVKALFANIVGVWKFEREEHKTDDLVAIIKTDQKHNHINLEPRSTVYSKLMKHNPGFDLVNYIVNPAPSKGRGTIAIWGVIGFASGQHCVLPIVLARS
jgi:hypothetical protein